MHSPAASAEAATLGLATIKNFENERRVTTRANLMTIQRALEDVGVELITPGAGRARESGLLWNADRRLARIVSLHPQNYGEKLASTLAKVCCIYRCNLILVDSQILV